MMRCFVTGLIAQLLHDDCFLSFLPLCGFSPFLILCCLLKLFYLFVGASSCGISCSHIWHVVVVVCCVIHTSLANTHSRPENVPVQDVIAHQLYFWKLLGYFSLFFLHYPFLPFFHVQLSRPWDTLKQTLGFSHLTDICTSLPDV